jgi:outer membrane protein OmpA-like peptidoglycan-associated protein
MRPLLIGILLFLIWSALSTWYYATRIFPVGEPAGGPASVEEVHADTAVVAPQKTVTLPEKPSDITLYFDYNKTVILPSAALDPYIQSGKRYLEADSSACLLITGHTCSIGTEIYNLDLGKRRAMAVKEALASGGLTPECIKISSRGESEPAADNSTENGRKKNRRVHIHIQP